MTARIHQISVSRGGVPKLPVPIARITRAGVEGDSQNDTRHHGGPDRAVCLFSLDVIRRLQAEGHPIRPGTAGENLTIEGLDWPRITPGAKLRIAAPSSSSASNDRVELEVVSYTRPCSTIRDSFLDLKHNRIFQDEHPGDSRLYARVLREGLVRVGDVVEVI